MKRLLRTIVTVLSSRAMPPIVIGLFFLLYIGIAFITDETLIALMALTRRSFILAALLALIPLNFAIRIVRETVRQLDIRRALSGKRTERITDLFDETVELPASPNLPELETRLVAVGYLHVYYFSPQHFASSPAFS
jgi:hypothetical protein